MTPSDHVLVLCFAVGMPIYGIAFGLPRFRRRVAEDPHAARLGTYRGTMIVLWVFTAAVTAQWLITGRPLPDLGLGPLRGWRLAVGCAVIGTLGAVLWRQRRLVRTDASARAQVRHQVRSFSDFLPRRGRELDTFVWLSITAGICEELLYRGYLIWYIGQYGGTLAGAILSSLMFGVGHLYQGPKGGLRIALLGGVFSGLYLATGALWVPMIVHAMVDISTGHLVAMSFED